MSMNKKFLTLVTCLGLTSSILSGCLTQDPSRARIEDKSAMYFGRNNPHKLEGYPDVNTTKLSSISVEPLQPLENKSVESSEKQSTSGYLQSKSSASQDSSSSSSQVATQTKKVETRRPNTTYKEDLTYEPEKGGKVQIGNNGKGFNIPTPLNSSKFEWPVPSGKVLARFGKNGNKFNEGINISAPLGSNVNAAGDGKVIYIGNNIEGYGNLVIVKHDNDLMTAYSHVKDVLVDRGNKVSKGQRIATIGNTGNVKEPQLHFSVRKGKKTINPERAAR